VDKRRDSILAASDTTISVNWCWCWSPDMHRLSCVAGNMATPSEKNSVHLVTFCSIIVPRDLNPHNRYTVRTPVRKQSDCPDTTVRFTLLDRRPHIHCNVLNNVTSWKRRRADHKSRIYVPSSESDHCLWIMIQTNNWSVVRVTHLNRSRVISEHFVLLWTHLSINFQRTVQFLS